MFAFGDERYEALVAGEGPKGLGVQVYRRIIGLTQKELAQQLGVCAATVSGWETGRSSISPERMRDISAILGVRVERLCNPDVDDIDRASHIALFKGHKCHRMVLRVEHEKSSEENIFNENNHTYVFPEYDADAINAYFARRWRERNARKKTRPARMYVGYRGLFGCNLDGSKLFLTRVPTLVDVLHSVDDEWTTLGRMLRGLRCYKGLKAVAVCKKISEISKGDICIAAQHYGNLEEGRGSCATALDDEFDVLAGLAKFYGVHPMVLIGLTPKGREMLRSQVKIE